MITFDEARQRLHTLGTARALDAETVALSGAFGRTLSRPHDAPLPAPPFDQSAMDGWALRAEDARAGVALRLLHTPQFAGTTAGLTLPPGSACRIFTGAQIPDGADAVVRQERAEVRDGALHVPHDVRPGQDIRRAGEHLPRGATIADAGARITPGLASALAMSGVAEVSVRRPLRALLLVGGDEVVPPGAPLSPGLLYDGNTDMLRHLTAATPALDATLHHAPDNAAALASLMRDALASFDLLITTGGASVGDRDLVRGAAAQVGLREQFWKIAQRPGKPLAVTTHPDHALLHIALPGTPAAVFTSWHTHVCAAIEGMLGRPLPALASAPWDGDAPRADSWRTWLALARRTGTGALTTLHTLPPHLQMSTADAIAIIPPHAEHTTPETVRWVPCC